ncbi:MAG: ATP-binding cassette domain-containing protein [Chloroflexi bacterium]|nr:ATP-binding cassette domain-containing protein [Chloroflexota bacterium]
MDTHQDARSPLLEVKNLSKYFPIKGGFFSRTQGTVKAVDDVSFYIQPGETLGLVGESGCGKTTVSRLVVRLYEPTSGEIWYGEGDDRSDLARLSQREFRPRRKNIQMIFQDPYASLDPRMTLLQIVGEPLSSNRLASGTELMDRVAEALKMVGLRPEYMSRYPHAFSGGQRQRVGIARALVTRPKFIVADEPVSALDVSVQAQILNLLRDLQDQLDLTYLFIAHDLSVIRHISDRVAVMYVGKLVESASRTELFSNPLHPYTEALMSAVPKPNPKLKTHRILSPGEVADPANPPSGCYFHPRCSYVRDICKTTAPELQEVRTDHFVACHRANELSLQGITAPADSTTRMSN